MTTTVEITRPDIDFKAKADELLPEGASYDACLNCGLCSSGCPASGLEGMDPRRFIRMAMLGMDEDIGGHFGGHYRIIHYWTLICLSLGILGESERKYLGPDLAEAGL